MCGNSAEKIDRISRIITLWRGGAGGDACGLASIVAGSGSGSNAAMGGTVGSTTSGVGGAVTSGAFAPATLRALTSALRRALASESNRSRISEASWTVRDGAAGSGVSIPSDPKPASGVTT